MTPEPPEGGTPYLLRDRNTTDERLIVFVKSPRPGTVKTRLAQSLGIQKATAAYVELVQSLLRSLSELSPVELRYAPDDAFAEIEPWLRPPWKARLQGQGDLGQRLHAAFTDAFEAGARRVLVIGSDCPYVTREDIQNAWTQLRACDVVLGPAKDGGYWLLGLSALQSSLFHNIPWSTENVLAATLERARATGLSVQLLRQLSDIDTAEDWAEYVQQTGNALSLES